MGTKANGATIGIPTIDQINRLRWISLRSVASVFIISGILFSLMTDGGYMTSTLWRSISSCFRRADNGGIDLRPLKWMQSEPSDDKNFDGTVDKPFFIGYPVEKLIPRISEWALPASLSVFLILQNVSAIESSKGLRSRENIAYPWQPYFGSSSVSLLASTQHPKKGCSHKPTPTPYPQVMDGGVWFYSTSGRRWAYAV